MLKTLLQLIFLTIYLFTHAFDSSAQSLPEDLPYPASPLAKNVKIHPRTVSIGHGDNWAITWADDGHQYSFFTDGKGFGVHPEDVSISPTMIIGTPPNVTGKDIPSESGTLPFLEGGSDSAKVSGLVMIESVLYAWVRNLNLPDMPKGTGSVLKYSKDYAKTWTYVDWNFPQIGYPVWMNAGQNYADAQDDYAYFISPNGESAYADYEGIILGRVHKDKILEQDAYRFFAGLDANEQAIWDAFEKRKPIFEHARGTFRPEIVYNPGLKKYMLSIASPYGEWMWWVNDNPERQPHMGIFEADNPWGPWKTIVLEENWGAPENRFSPRIPAKWISEDGKSFYLLYSCIPTGPYRFNLQKVTLN
uniref:DUF4185 domain-containing protein n=1 Tax=Ningiella ruwaisensis TaxID=2364274 RepID=UPI00109FEEA0|nr:DUF4185 domain-containing protein [Ningiella ruwaisensis]